MNDITYSPAFWPVLITALLLLAAVTIGGLALLVMMFARQSPENTKAKIQASIIEAMTIAESAERNAVAAKKADALLADVAPELAKATK